MMTETQATDALTYVISPASADSLPYVLSTWGKYLERRILGDGQADGFLKALAPYQAKIIKVSSVLTSMTEDGRIAGFIVFQPGILHWVATRAPHRKKGIAKSLLAAAGITRTSPLRTPDLRFMARYVTMFLKAA